jgi:hypothetical protein
MSNVYLYDAGGSPEADLPGIAAYLSATTGVEATPAGDIISVFEKAAAPSGSPRPDSSPALKELARGIASAKVNDLNKRDSFETPFPVETRFLERQLKRVAKRAFGNLYDGMAAMSAFRSFLAPRGDLQIIFFNQIVGTWSDDDLRYHARVLVAGSPAIISIPGVVLAPARPREYYLYQQGARASGASDCEIELKMREAMGGRYVDHEDGRIPEILKGYALQAVVYWIFGEDFCADPDCRLFNAHWQEEMIRAQLGGAYELCPRHTGLLMGRK